MIIGGYVSLFYELCRFFLQKKWLSIAFCDWGSRGGSLGEALWKPLQNWGKLKKSISLSSAIRGKISRPLEHFIILKGK